MSETNNWWLWWNYSWLRIHKAPLRSAKAWFHICVRVNQEHQLSVVNVSVNGGNIKSMKQELEVRDMTNIVIHLGTAHHIIRPTFGSQYTGMITNINIYKANSRLDIQKMSSDPCQFASSGDVLAWEDMEWERHGDHIEDVIVEDGQVCGDKPNFNIPLILDLNWFSADKTCHILNNGTISEMNDVTDVGFISSSFNRSCDYIWSPYIYNESTRNFSSYNTGNHIENLLRNISWYWDSPEQGKYVAVYLRSLNKYMIRDFDDTETFCVSCNVPKETVFTMWGVCDQSLLGRSGLQEGVLKQYQLKYFS